MHVSPTHRNQLQNDLRVEYFRVKCNYILKFYPYLFHFLTTHQVLSLEQKLTSLVILQQNTHRRAQPRLISMTSAFQIL